MMDGLTGWETTRLSKHFILLDFLADNTVYRSRRPLPFDAIWNEEHDGLAKGLCNDLLEPLMREDRFGPISVADAFWPTVFKRGHYETKSSPGKHRWTAAGAAVDIALYRLVDEGKRGRELRKEVLSVKAIDGCRERVLSYPETEFVCVTYKPEGPMENMGHHGAGKIQNLRAHHVRVGRYFNLLDFCRNGRAVEEGCELVPKKAGRNDRDYSPIREEPAARSFAAALDPLVEQVGRVSVVRGMETAGFSNDAHAELHRWDRDGPWRLVFVLPQGVDPEEACTLLRSCPHYRGVLPSWHPSESYSLALEVDKIDYGEHWGLRPKYRG